jgi:hypothetical protein
MNTASGARLRRIFHVSYSLLGKSRSHICNVAVATFGYCVGDVGFESNFHMNLKI